MQQFLFYGTYLFNVCILHFTTPFETILELLLAVDCRWSSFGNWSPCSKTCGNGYKTSQRYRMNNATHGGKECEGETVRMVQCNLNNCPGIKQQHVKR